MVREILKKHWNNHLTDTHPKNRRMKVIDELGIKGMSTENIRFLFNEICKQKQGFYLECGMLQGSSLISAAYMNEGQYVGIDNFTEFDNWKPKLKKGDTNKGTKSNMRLLLENIRKTKQLNILPVAGDFETFLPVVTNIIGRPIDVYFYDAKHDEESQYRGLEMAKKYLAKDAVIIVDDLNFERVERANDRWVKDNPEFQSTAKLKTKRNKWPTWWNGIEIIERK